MSEIYYGLSDAQIEAGYRVWLQRGWKFGAADSAVAPFLRLVAAPGWVKLSRQALFLSCDAMAGRLGISATAYKKLERGELAGTTSLNSLRRVAEAMDCELVYAIRPRRQIPFSRIVWERILPLAKDHPMVMINRAYAKPLALATIVRMKLQLPEVRRQLGWRSLPGWTKERIW